MSFYIQHILFPAFSLLSALLLSSSCSSSLEQPLEMPNKGETVKIGLNLRAIGSSEGEDQINTLRILQVDDNIAGAILKNTFIADLQENPLTVELMSGQSKIYVVANEASTQGMENPNLAAVSTYAELTQMALDHFLASSISPQNIPMLGTATNVRIFPSPTDPQSEANPGTVSVDGAAPGYTLDISLERLVCKLELCFDLKRFVDISQYPSDFFKDIKLNVPKYIPLFDDYTGTQERKEISLGMNSGDYNFNYYPYYLIYRYPLYLPSFTFSPRNDETKAPFVNLIRRDVENPTTSSVKDPYPLVYFGHNINPEEGEIDYTLHRNCSYTLMLKAFESTINAYISPMLWHYNVDVTPNVPSRLNSPDSVVMDKALWEGKYTVEVSFNSEFPYGYNYTTWSPIQVWVGDQPVENGELPNKPDWLISAKLNNFDRVYGSFTFTYQETQGDHPDYVITLKAGNIVKKLRVVYGPK